MSKTDKAEGEMRKEVEVEERPQVPFKYKVEERR